MQLPDALIVEICIQTAEAMDYLRQQGIAHRDVRAANFLVDSEKPLNVVTADFGLAHLIKHGNASTTRTQYGPLCEWHWQLQFAYDAVCFH